MKMKLGKRAVDLSKPALRLRDYRTSAPVALPPHPATFGHGDMIKDWLMLMNDSLGICVPAAICHMIMLLTSAAGKMARFDNASIVALYSAVTGYDPNEPSTDQGTNMVDMMEYWRKTGVTDADGIVHKIGAWLALDRQYNAEQYNETLYLFDGVPTGIQCPDSAQTQFQNGVPWSVVRGARVEGGHGILGSARDALLKVATWGQDQEVEEAFMSKYYDEAYVVISQDDIVNGKSPEGYDFSTLPADMEALAAE